MANAEISNQEIIITLPVEKVYPGIKEKLEEYLNHFPIKVIPVKKLSQAQNGLIHVLLKQFGDEIGYTLIEIKELMKEQFAIATDKLDFSTAKCDMETANEFISFIIEQALELGINLYILSKCDKRYKHILEKIKIRLLSGIEVNESDFNFMKLNANLFKSIKFIKKRKAKKKWQMLKSQIKK